MCKQLTLQRASIKYANILQILNSDMSKHVVQCYLKKEKDTTIPEFKQKTLTPSHCSDSFFHF